MKKAVSGLGLILALSPLAQAMADSNFYIGTRLGAAAMQGGCAAGVECDNQEVAGGFITGFDFGKVFFLDGISLEGTYDYLGNYEFRSINGNATTTSFSNIYSFTLAPKFDFAITPTTDLFAKVGVAWTGTDAGSSTNTENNLMAGAGIDYRATDLVNFRFEYQYLKDIDTGLPNGTNNTPYLANNHMVTAGVTFHFGRRPLVTVEDTPIVEPFEEIQEEVVYEEITPVVEPVIIPSSVSTVNFAFDDATLSEDQKTELDIMIQRLKDYKEATATITGFTDSTGPEEINLQLSQDRAKTVAEYFMQNGIGLERLDVQALGDSDPVATNSTLEGRKQNRRVEISSPEFVTEG